MPDHSTFSKNRHGRFRDSDLLRHLFETVVRAASRGLVGGEGFAVDASLIEADANKQRSVASGGSRADWHASGDRRAVKEYLDTLDDAAFGAASEVTPKFVSPVRSGRAVDRREQGAAFFAYADNYLIDLKADHRRRRSLPRHPPG